MDQLPDELELLIWAHYMTRHVLPELQARSIFTFQVLPELLQKKTHRRYTFGMETSAILSRSGDLLQHVGPFTFAMPFLE